MTLGANLLRAARRSAGARRSDSTVGACLSCDTRAPPPRRRVRKTLAKSLAAITAPCPHEHRMGPLRFGRLAFDSDRVPCHAVTPIDDSARNSPWDKAVQEVTPPYTQRLKHLVTDDVG